MSDINANLTLSAEQFDALLEWLDRPTEPNLRLAEYFRRLSLVEEVTE